MTLPCVTKTPFPPYCYTTVDFYPEECVTFHTLSLPVITKVVEGGFPVVVTEFYLTYDRTVRVGLPKLVLNLQ